MTIPGIDLSLLANASFPSKRFGAGDVIFSTGDDGDNM
jgi:hypothetical protein